MCQDSPELAEELADGAPEPVTHRRAQRLEGLVSFQLTLLTLNPWCQTGSAAGLALAGSRGLQGSGRPLWPSLVGGGSLGGGGEGNDEGDPWEEARKGRSPRWVSKATGRGGRKALDWPRGQVASRRHASISPLWLCVQVSVSLCLYVCFIEVALDG